MSSGLEWPLILRVWNGKNIDWFPIANSLCQNLFSKNPPRNINASRLLHESRLPISKLDVGTKPPIHDLAAKASVYLFRMSLERPTIQGLAGNQYQLEELQKFLIEESQEGKYLPLDQKHQLLRYLLWLACVEHRLCQDKALNLLCNSSKLPSSPAAADIRWDPAKVVDLTQLATTLMPHSLANFKPGPWRFLRNCGRELDGLRFFVGTRLWNIDCRMGSGYTSLLL